MAGAGNTTAVLVMALTIAACCSNVLLLEKIMTDAPNSPAMVTFAIYVAIVMENFITSPKILHEHVIPIKSFLLITALSYSTSILNNMALSYNVSMPTLLIFRSGSLMANMIVSIIAFKRSYPVSKYLSVVMVTSGIILATLASADQKRSADEVADNGGFGTWMVGISMLTYALFGSAVMGVFQEKVFSQYGKRKDEVLFFTHLLGLPGFLMNYSAILTSVQEFTASENLNVAGFNLPYLWVYISGNLALNMACIKGVYFLLSEWSSLSVTMVLTLRKFLSLLLSIYIFKNPFTSTHWLGTILVFSGSALFSGLIPLPGGEKQE